MDSNAFNQRPWNSNETKTFKIYIDPLQGCVFELPVASDESILMLKMKIEDLKGIPVKQQHLLLNYKELENNATLDELSIADQSTLQLVLSLRSGPVSTLRRIIPAMNCSFLKDLIIQNRKEIGNLQPGTRLSIMVFREGIKVKMFKMLEKIDSSGSVDPLLGLSLRSSPGTQLVLKSQRTKHHEDPKIIKKVKFIKAKLLEQKSSKKKAVDSIENYSPFMNQILNENAAPVKKKLPPIASFQTINEESPRRKVEFSQVPVLPNIGPNVLPSHHTSVSQGSVGSKVRSVNEMLSIPEKNTLDSFRSCEHKETDSGAPKRRSSGSISLDNDVSLRNEGLKLKPPSGVTHKPDRKMTDSQNNLATISPLCIPEERRNFSLADHKQSSSLSPCSLVSNIENDDYVPAQKTLATAPGELTNLETFNDDFTQVKKKSKNRCSECRKKLTISNKYECRCGLLLCSMHRYSEAHSCSFDYKTEGRKLIKKVNPLVIAPKLPKI